MTTPVSVFLLGPGFVGLEIIDNLLAANYSITALVRNPELGNKLSSRGVFAIAGTLADSNLITEQVARHHLTINTSSSDDLPSVQAILSGVRQRVQQGLPSTLIHTSGAGCFIDDAKGEYKSEVVYRDDDPSMIDALPLTAMHRNVDTAILEAAREFGDKAKITIMVPPVIFGLNPTHNRLSFALPTLVTFALKHGYGGLIGKGANTWAGIHVKDLGTAYMTLVNYLKTPESGEAVRANPYFFVDDGVEISWGKVAELVAEVLHKMGKIPEKKVKLFEEKHYPDAFGPVTEIVAGGNARTKGVRLAQLGWKSVEKDVWKSLEEDEIPFIVSSQK